MDVVVMGVAGWDQISKPGDLRQPPGADVMRSGARVGLLAAVHGAAAPLRFEGASFAAGGVAMGAAGSDGLAGSVEDDRGDPAATAEPVEGLQAHPGAVGHPRG